MKKIRKISLLIRNIGLIILILSFAMPLCFTLPEQYAIVMLYSGIVLFFILEIIFMVLSLIFWRCEYCDQRFPLKPSLMDKAKICPFCGHELK